MEPSSKRLKTESIENTQPPTSSRSPWTGFDKNILYQYLRRPSEYADSIVFSNEMCTVIKDAYPKAATHLLLIPNESFLNIQEVRQLVPSHCEKVRQLHAVARRIAGERDSTDNVIKIGYHGIPSLYPLHIHIVSGDFDSPCLKNKKHWNSFTSDYFVSIDLVESWLSRGVTASSQMYTVDEYDAMLTMPLRCNCCGKGMKNILTLKEHISSRKCRKK